MKKNLLIILSLVLVSIQVSAGITETLMEAQDEVRTFLYPSKNDILLINKMKDTQRQKVAQELLDKKKDGVYLLYNLIYDNFVINLEKFCVFNFRVKDCKKFSKHMYGILNDEMQQARQNVIRREQRKKQTQQGNFLPVVEDDHLDIVALYVKIINHTEDTDLNKFINQYLEEFEAGNEDGQSIKEFMFSQYQDKIEEFAIYLNQEQVRNEDTLTEISHAGEPADLENQKQI